MPVQHEIKRSKGRLATGLPFAATPNHALRRNNNQNDFGIDEDKLYNPDWEAASDSDLEPYVKISHQDEP